MATFGKIDGAEPSTVTFSLRSVTLDINGATQHQELVTLAGSESSLAVAQVRASAPASTEFGLVVRVADPSTGAFAISSIAGRTLVDQNSTTWQAQVSSLAGRVLVDQNSTVWPVQVSSVAGAVIVRSSAANALVTAYQSTATDLAMTAHGNQSSNSSVYLPVRMTNGTAFLTPGTDYTDGSTASNLAGPVLTFDNGTNATMRAVSLTNGLPVNVVAGAAGGSTLITVRQSTVGDLRAAVYQSTAADLNALVLPGSSNATRWFPVQISDGSTWISDSTNRAIRVNVVAGAAGGSTEVTVRQSTYTDFNTLSRLADRDNSTKVAAVLSDASPASTAYGLVVRVASGNAVAISHAALTELGDVINAGMLDVNVLAGALSVSTGSVTVHQGSTNFSVQVSTGAVSVSTGSITVHQGSTNFSVQVSTGAVSVSTGSVTVHQGSTTFSVLARNTTSSGGGIEGSTTAPAVGVLGLHVRQVFPTLLSTRVVITSSNSTALYTLVSSAADPLRHKVYAYSITSTETTPSTLVFMSSNAIDRWAVAIGSGSSGVTGANLTISPPGWLFHSDANNALRCLIEKGASTQCIVTLSISYFTEP